MRFVPSLLLFSIVTLGACKAEPSPAKTAPREAESAEQVKAIATIDPIDPKLGAHASTLCREAMGVLVKLDHETNAETFETATIQAAWTGPLHQWIRTTDSALGRKDAALITESLTRLEDHSDPVARQRELALIVTQVRTAALFETRRLLSATTDAAPETPQRADQWDTAWCLWNAALRPLARRADALPKRGGEGWETMIVEAFQAGRAALDDQNDPSTPLASRQIIEKGSYAVAHRLILAAAEAPEPAAITEAAAMLDMLEDRIADRNGPGLERMRAMLNGDPTAVDPLLIERELAVAFAKRARKYCDKAVIRAELRTPNAIAETWEGILYTKVILPSMREALTPAGFDADAYTTDWQAYLETVESGDAEAAAAISTRLVKWNCAYQDHLGIAKCSSSSNEAQ